MAENLLNAHLSPGSLWADVAQQLVPPDIEGESRYGYPGEFGGHAGRHRAYSYELGFVERKDAVEMLVAYVDWSGRIVTSERVEMPIGS